MAITAATPTEFDIVFPAQTYPGVNPYSTRGLRGTLSPIDAARGNNLLARTVNGTLIDISAPQMRKYKLEVTGNDQAPPPTDGLWVGMTVTVNCHVELAYRTGAGGSPERTPVSGSTRVEGAYSYYRPSFQMMIVELQISREEWESVYNWQLSLEEI
jgi:hypothetical protein